MTAKQLALLLIFSVTVSCGSSESSDDAADDTDTTLEATLSSIQENIFTPTCATASCHASSASSGGLSLADGESFGELVGVESTEADGVNRVTASEPENSYLIDKLENTQSAAGGSGSTMPRGGAALSTDEIQAIRDWITAGAANN